MSQKMMIATVLMGFCFNSMAWAAQSPMEALKEPIEKGIAVLRDPAYETPEKREKQREKIWSLIKESFDFKLVSLLALSRNRRLFSESQIEEFTEKFTEMLKNSYLDNIQGEYRNEEVAFLEQEKITDDKAVVKTHLIQENKKVPMDYSMKRIDGKWKVYDVNIEGVSLVKNYRTQFKEYLMNHSPAELLAHLEKKNQEHRENRRADTQKEE